MKLKEATKQNNENKKQIDNQLDAKHQVKLNLAKLELKKRKAFVYREQEKKRKRDDIHQHRLAEIAACEASSKRVKEMAVEGNGISRYAGIQSGYSSLTSLSLV